MGNAFAAVLKNEAPRGRDMTYEDRNYKVSHNSVRHYVKREKERANTGVGSGGMQGI